MTAIATHTGRPGLKSFVRAVIYLRISEDRDGDEEGVTRHREDCERRCRERGWQVVGVLSDNDVSAKGHKRRTDFERLIRMVEAREVDVVVAWHLDRLQRNRRDEVRLYEACQRAGVTISLVRGPDLEWETPTGRYLADNLGAIARLEIEIKGDRYRRYVVQQVEQGRRIGGRRPFGYGVTVGHDVVKDRPIIDYDQVNEPEAEAIRDGYRMLLAGSSLASIARAWTAAGHATPQGKQWRADSVRYVLANPRNGGLRGHGSVPERGRRRIVAEHKAAWPAIVDEDVWRAAAAILGAPGRKCPPRSDAALLTGLAECGVCGGPIHGGRTRDGHKTYRCRDHLGHVARRQEPVDEWVTAVVLERLSAADAADLLADDTRPDVGQLRERVQALRVRRGSLARLLADGTLGEVEVREQSDRLAREIGAIEGQLTDAGRARALGGLAGSPDPWAVWATMPTPARRMAITALYRVTVLPPGRGTRTFRPETVVITPT